MREVRSTVVDCHCFRCKAVRAAFFIRSPILTAGPFDYPDFDAVGITYVLGPSGSGKSILVERIAAAQGWCAPVEPDPEQPLLHQVDTAIDEMLRFSACLGLADPRLLMAPIRTLSEGQRERARLVLAFANRPRGLVIDEFLSTLDAVTAAAVAEGVHRLAKMLKVHIVAAGTQEDIIGHLGPDRIVRTSLRGAAVLQGPPPRVLLADEIRCEPGDIADFEELEFGHYSGGLTVSPDKHELHIIRAMLKDVLVGAVVFSAPYPRSWARWEPFRELNERLCVSQRTVVHPQYRGIGAAKRLADPALAPRPRIVSFSSMATYYPFKVTAGFRTIPKERTLTARWDAIKPSHDQESEAGLRAFHAAKLLTEWSHLMYLAGLEAEVPRLSVEAGERFQKISQMMPLSRVAADREYAPMAEQVYP